MRNSPFDHRQDRELGDALRSALTGHDEESFVRGVVNAAARLQLHRADEAEWWEILNEWARPGLAAAAIGAAAAAALWWSGSQNSVATTAELADPLQAAVAIPAEFLTSQAPDLNEVLAIELGN